MSRRPLGLIVAGAAGALLTVAWDQLFFERVTMYYVGNGYDVPSLLSLAQIGPVLLVPVMLGMAVRHRTELCGVWAALVVFGILGSRVGSPTFGAVIQWDFAGEVLVAAVFNLVLLVVGRLLAGIARPGRRLTMVCS